MNTTSLMAGASRFAHFAGFSRSSRRAADDDNRQDDVDAEDEDKDPDASDEDGDDDTKTKKSKRARKAEDEDKDPDASDDDEDKDPDASDEDGDDEPKTKKSKRAKKADEDDKDPDAEDDDEDEMKGNSASAKARRREQARIAHILGSKAAANNPVLAVSLACTTRMTRREATRVLREQPAQANDDDGGNRHSRRDRQQRNANLGTDAPALSGLEAVAASWTNTFKRVGITPRG